MIPGRTGSTVVKLPVGGDKRTSGRRGIAVRRAPTPLEEPETVLGTGNGFDPAGRSTKLARVAVQRWQEKKLWFGWPAFWWVVRVVCVAGACVVLVVLCGCFLITQQRVFQSVFSVLACCGLAWFFFEWTFLSCPFFWMGSGLFSCCFCRAGFFVGLVRWFLRRV